ncbi:hypothetical protein [Nostoc sp. MG11]|nr:hypothetical protein [Nostoc sp. MG11]
MSLNIAFLSSTKVRSLFLNFDYFERDENIEVVRVLYAGQDIERILEQE